MEAGSRVRRWDGAVCCAYIIPLSSVRLAPYSAGIIGQSSNVITSLGLRYLWHIFSVPYLLGRIGKLAHPVFPFCGCMCNQMRSMNGHGSNETYHFLWNQKLANLIDGQGTFGRICGTDKVVLHFQ